MRKICLAIISTFSLLSFSELDALNQLQKQAADLAAGASSGSRDLEAADYLMGKFKFEKDGRPTWYPTFYPTSGEMGPGSNFTPRLYLAKPFKRTDTILAPVLEIFKKKNTLGLCEENLVPSLLAFQPNVGSEYCMDLSKDEAKKYKVDQSGVASLEESPQQGKYQGALISVTNMNALNEEQKKLFMSDPNASIKTILESLSSDAEKQALVDPRRIQLIKYNPHKDYPLGLGSITAQVGSISVDIPVDLPPEPNCQLRIAPGQMEPFQPGSTVKFELSVNSVTLSAKKIDGEVEIGEEYDVDLAEAPRFSASSFGSTQKLVDFEFTIPDDFSGSHLPEHPSEMGWMVSAKVAGIVGNNYQSCQLSEPARVRMPPAPDCNLVASSQEADPGAQVTLTLSKRSPELIVSEAFIGEANVSESMTSSGIVNHSFRRNNSPTETVTATLKGPGGQRTCSVTLNASCPFLRQNRWVTLGLTTAGDFCARNKISGTGWELCSSKTYNLATFEWGISPKTYRPLDSTQQYHLGIWREDLFTTGDFGSGIGTRTIDCRRSNNFLCLRQTLPGTSNHWSISIKNTHLSSCSVSYIVVRQKGGCFTPDTQIKMANGSLKLASDIREDDYVFNPHYGAGVRVRKVVKGPEKKSLYEVKTSKGKVEVTEDHPFLTGRGWVQAMALKKGDKLLGNGEPKLVSQVKKLKYQGPQDVWNFELDSDDPMAHVVIANGIPTGDLVTQLELKKPKAKLP